MLIAFALIIAGLYVRYVDPWWVETVRLKTFDAYNRMNYRQPSDQNPVFIIDLDEKSLAEVGQWPWPRSTIAQLLQSMREYKIPVVGFDMIFAEADRTNPDLVADRLPAGYESLVNQLKNIPTNDQIMAQKMQDIKVVLGQAGTNQSGGAVDDDEARQTASQQIRTLPSLEALESSVQGFRGTRGVKDPTPNRFLNKKGVLLYNIGTLESNARGLGVISVDDEVDGIVRRVPLVSEIEGVIKPTLTLEMIRVAMNGNSVFTVVNQGGLQQVGMQTRQVSLKIPVDGHGRVWVNYAKPDRFNTVDNTGRLFVSASDVLYKRVPIEKLQGRMALVGTSAVGLVDIRATPVSPRQPGVEVHANLIENLIEGSYLSYPLQMVMFEIIAAGIACLLIIFFVPRLGPLLTLAGFGVAVGSLVAVSWVLFVEQRIFLDITYGTALVFVVFATVSFSNYIRDSQEKKQVRTAFAQYLSPDLVEQLAEHPDQLRLGGETKRMTLLFCDVRGFTTISEQFKTDPQGLTQLINRLLTPLTNEILLRRGTIDKYMGDCIMAFWNAPIPVAEQEYQACKAALSMMKALEDLNQQRKMEAQNSGAMFLPLKVGIGLNTGDCVVGNMGSEQRFDYSVLGDAVNLAARLEGQSKAYGVNIVIGPITADRVRNRLPIVELDLIAVKGKSEAVNIYALIGDEPMYSANEYVELSTRHQEIIDNYRKQEWKTSLALIQENIRLCDGVLDDFYDILRARINYFIAQPPPKDWDGVYVAQTK
ncbi:MAG: CHASE2 domain-containing protein [Alphaproteobacteria bacterium]